MAACRAARGLLTTRATSIDERRIRGVERSEPLLLRVTGGARCLAIATGLRVGRGSERGGTLLLPPAPLATAIEVESAVLGTPIPGAAALAGRGAAGSLPAWIAVAALVLVPVAVALASDRSRSLGHTLVTDLDGCRVAGLAVRLSGPTALRRRNARRDRRDDAAVCVQRRMGLTSVTVTTAAGRQQYPVTDLANAAATDLAHQLLPAASALVEARTPAVESRLETLAASSS